MSDDVDIEIREIKPDDFLKGILSGEVNPHDVDLIIKFRNGKIVKKEIKWNDILNFYKHHHLSIVNEYYEMLVDFNI